MVIRCCCITHNIGQDGGEDRSRTPAAPEDRLRANSNNGKTGTSGRHRMHSTHLSRYERNLTAPSIDVVKKIADVLGMSIDTLIYRQQDERAKGSINDNELLTMFAKVQSLSNRQQDTIKDFLSAYILKSDLQKNLTVAK